MHDDLFDHPFELGAMYAAYRHGQDRQTDELLAGAAALASPPGGTTTVDVRVRVDQDDDPDQAVVVNALDFVTEELPASWDEYIGQERLKLRMQVAIKSAVARGERLPHMLIYSNTPGTGKSTVARMLASQLGEELGRPVGILELTPPFDNIYVLVKAAEQLLDGEILFIDEIHKLKEKRRGDEILLKILEDGVAYLPDGEVVVLNNITIIGATTEKDALLPAVLDRFVLERLAPYTIAQLGRIAIRFARQFGALDIVSNDLALDVALASLGSPREIRRLMETVRDLFFTLRRPPTIEELLIYKEIEPDGLRAEHIEYLTRMLTLGRRESKDGTVEYLGGEKTMRTGLCETAEGLARIERVLIERGFVQMTGRGRALTDLGIERAEELIAAGKGVPR